MTNDDGLAHWSGPAGEHWAAEADRYDRMNHQFANLLFAAAAPLAGESFLDVGCGNGVVTLAIAEAVVPDGKVVGLDLSRQMLEVAHQRVVASGLDNVELVHGDAQVQNLAGVEVDGLVSRFGVMFFADPAAAFANLSTALRSGGRLAFTCWQDMASNDWVMVPAMAALAHVPVPEGLGSTAAHGAFSLADPKETTTLLEAAGFVDVAMDKVDAPMWMGATVEDAMAFMRTTEFAMTLFTGVEPAQAEAGWAAVTAVLADHLGPDGVELQGHTWLVTAKTP
jgi:SAM-dependent methyltransferase